MVRNGHKKELDRMAVLIEHKEKLSKCMIARILKEVNMDQKEKIHQLLDLCMQAKASGYNCWFDFSPVFDWIQVSIYKDVAEEQKPCIRIAAPLAREPEGLNQICQEVTLDEAIEIVKELI